MRFTSVTLAAALIALSGCAAIERQEAADSEELLRAAGFQVLPANTPAREQKLKELRPRQVFARSENGERRYVFADPDNCRCLYAGDEAEYQKLQQLRAARIEAHNRLVMQAESNRSLNSQLSGPWKPEGLVAEPL